jgi:signal peptidase I
MATIRKRRSGRLRPLVQLAAFAGVALTARASLADHYRVPSGSMEPTVRVGDHIVVAKAAYGLRLPMTDAWLVRYGAPARGDVVVLEPPEGDEAPGGARPELLGAVLLKRVVALPGELVEVRGGRVLVGGSPAREPWASLEEGGGPDLAPARVPAGKLLVLGDNRGNSRDGRAFGFVDERRVLGRALAIVARGGQVTLGAL